MRDREKAKIVEGGGERKGEREIEGRMYYGSANSVMKDCTAGREAGRGGRRRGVIKI